MSINTKWVFWGFAAIAAFFLVTEHWAHLYGFLPFIFLALCPLVHLFHGHGSHGDKEKDSKHTEHINH